MNVSNICIVMSTRNRRGCNEKGVMIERNVYYKGVKWDRLTVEPNSAGPGSLRLDFWCPQSTPKSNGSIHV